MSHLEETNRAFTGPEAQRAARKPYHKPVIRYQRVFETTALSCGKIQSTQSGCHLNRRAS